MRGPWLLCELDLPHICVIATGSGPRQGGPQGRTGGTDALPTAVDYGHCFIARDIKVPCTWSLGLRQPSSGRDRLLLLSPFILDVLNHFGHSGTEKREGGGLTQVSPRIGNYQSQSHSTGSRRSREQKESGDRVNAKKTTQEKA